MFSDNKGASATLILFTRTFTYTTDGPEMSALIV
jgi:hypothetical protein